MSKSAPQFRLGLNYWPGNSAMSWWRCFEAEGVGRDFARIRAAGFDSVRIFLTWEDFQPAADRVCEHALDRLVSVVDSAGRAGLVLIPTLFTGHMSGVNWFPQWAVDATRTLDRDSPAARFRIVAQGQVQEGRLRNWYADESIGAAQALLAGAAAAVLCGHPALWAWDLGNENSNCCLPPSRQAGLEWLDRITASIRAADPAALVTIGLHMEDLIEDRRLGPAEAARFCDFLCMHGYPIYADFVDDPTDERLLPFLALITRWLGGREVLFEEFGAPALPAGEALVAARRLAPKSTLLEETSAAAFTGRALAALRASGSLGAMLWCYQDYAEELWGDPPLDEATHERWFGLWRRDGSPKPVVAGIRPFEGSQVDAWTGVPDWIDIDAGEFYQRPRDHLCRLYRRFLDSPDP